ncbi:MAG TPA: DUF294 nucleotidyltransferase-like domain-containing protein, partial [Acidimicrobiia bacterium]|nr:DUF294 nucleotidyltransferase-like domain-containing protein [Acidimicrobiia bacterium]
MNVSRLRASRDELLRDETRRGRAFGVALARLLDTELRAAFEDGLPGARVALLALGSYARRELCPGSDVDVLLVHEVRGRRDQAALRKLAERLWYLLWDAGFVTGHGTRTVKESLALADEDLNALTALLDVRTIAGDETLGTELEGKTHVLAQRRQGRLLRQLADASELRRVRPGAVAELLEPDVKDGAGGLRDAHALDWAGWALGEPGGIAALRARGYVSPDDCARIDAGRALLLDIRVELQRTTGSHSDRLALQEQDAVARALEFADADALVRALSSAAREIAWIAADVWRRLIDMLAGPARRGSSDRVVAEHVVLRDGRVHIQHNGEEPVPAYAALEAAIAAAEHDAPFDRASLTTLRDMTPPSWDVWQRAAFLRLLRTGQHAVPVFEALDHEGVLSIFLPEWEHVRSRPQRNAYHRFTVDRHLLEAVAECARLLDGGEDRDAPHDIDRVVARACRRPELLLLAALLHDLAKGMDGDHSVVGGEVADRIARRIGLDSEGREILVWLVQNHLLMAEVATRRDLSDASVADNVARRCAGDAERLRLLYLLTIGDSRATGPAA